MTKLVFDAIGEHFFEAGVSQGVLFPGAPSAAVAGVAWNGLTSVAVSPDGGDANDQYADNIKYLSLRGAENVKGTIECFTYPDEFAPCMGYKTSGKDGFFSQQKKEPFSFCCITQVGNDVDGTDLSEKLHIFWNATTDPIEKTYETINDSPEAIAFSFEFATVPVAVEEAGYKPTSYFEMTRTTTNATTYDSIKNTLYGTDGSGGTAGTDSHLMMPDDIIALLKAQ